MLSGRKQAPGMHVCPGTSSADTHETQTLQKQIQHKTTQGKQEGESNQVKVNFCMLIKINIPTY